MRHFSPLALIQISIVVCGLGCSALPCWAQKPAAAQQAYQLEVNAPGDLKKLLLEYLDLARFQQSPELSSITPEELTRLINAAPAQVKSLLETQGYFGTKSNLVRSTHSDGRPVLILTVDPGVPSVISSIDLQVQGPLKTPLETGDALAQKLVAELRNTWSLPAGEPFTQSNWVAAKNRAQGQLRNQGYPSAVWVETQAQVDPQQHTVALSGVLQSGPLFRLGPMRIVGLSRYNETTLRNLANFAPGTPYSQQLLLDYQERLGKLGLFESVLVEMDFDPATAEAAPVTVTVREQSRQQATTGVGYSDKSGPRGTLEYRNRHPFGWPVQTNNKLELGGKLRSWEGELISDPDASRYRKLLATRIARQEAADETTFNARIRAGRSIDNERIERLIFAEYLSGTRQAQNVDERAQALSINYNWVWRDIDNVVLPTKGLTSSIQFGLGSAQSNFGRSGAFSRITTRNVLYWPLSKKWHAQARLELGQIVSPLSVGMPDALLFRAGGDESVRGYAYRSLGPDKNGVLSSGRSLLTTSVELAHPLWPSLPNLWWAMFVDAGNAANQPRSLKPVLGYGLGVRFRSPVGPLRLDVAHGQKTGSTRLHLSVGIAF